MTVDGEVVGAIGPGLLVLVGVTHDDRRAEAPKLADKLAKLRLLDDDAGVMNRSVLDEGAAVLVVSQFTLYGDTARATGRRGWPRPGPSTPSRWSTRSSPSCAALGVTVATGRFRTDMAVELVNDGPATVIIDV